VRRHALGWDGGAGASSGGTGELLSGGRSRAEEGFPSFRMGAGGRGERFRSDTGGMEAAGEGTEVGREPEGREGTRGSGVENQPLLREGFFAGMSHPGTPQGDRTSTPQGSARGGNAYGRGGDKCGSGCTTGGGVGDGDDCRGGSAGRGEGASAGGRPFPDPEGDCTLLRQVDDFLLVSE